VRAAVRTEVERTSRLWGAAGRAEALLAACRPWREVEHFIAYNVDEGLDEAGITTLLEEGRRRLARIPGVRRVEIGEAVREDARFRLCWSIRFASEAVIASYAAHPDHVDYADTLFRPNAGDRLSIDYRMRGD
jgi:Stress responsive A/B Barrel Domain.